MLYRLRCAWVAPPWAPRHQILLDVPSLNRVSSDPKSHPNDAGMCRDIIVVFDSASLSSLHHRCLTLTHVPATYSLSLGTARTPTLSSISTPRLRSRCIRVLEIKRPSSNVLSHRLSDSAVGPSPQSNAAYFRQPRPSGCEFLLHITNIARACARLSKIVPVFHPSTTCTLHGSSRASPSAQSDGLEQPRRLDFQSRSLPRSNDRLSGSTPPTVGRLRQMKQRHPNPSVGKGLSAHQDLKSSSSRESRKRSALLEAHPSIRDLDQEQCAIERWSSHF
ncbi:hypothetical protein C8R45DRAFT_1101400 [Mycena sanguinolenta]|nr:hypothetical protein C8R45DRAFT_1101400 [Mycena sanguinolenta]